MQLEYCFVSDITSRVDSVDIPVTQSNDAASIGHSDAPPHSGDESSNDEDMEESDDDDEDEDDDDQPGWVLHIPINRVALSGRQS